MKLSSKARYGLYVVVELARRDGQQPVPVSELATATGVTEKYLEHILAILKKNDIVEATRGTNGGYRLKGKPCDINIGVIIRSLEDDLQIVKCIGQQCSANCKCVSHSLWEKLYQTINNFLDSVTLQQLMEDNL